MTHQVLSLFVAGTPIAQGSKRHVGNGVMVESAKGLKDWRHAITQEASLALRKAGRRAFPGPVHVVLAFYVTRPKSHHVAGDQSRPPKVTAPIRPTTKPDLDKTTRAVLDALTAAAVWHDDAQVVNLQASKHYGGPFGGPGVCISVWSVSA